METVAKKPTVKKPTTTAKKTTTVKDTKTVAKPAANKVILKKGKPKVNEKQLDTENIKDTVKQIVESEREIKYKYPEGVDNQIDKKTFRQKTRNKLRSFERELAKLTDGKEKVKLNKEYQAYRKEVLLVP